MHAAVVAMRVAAGELSKAATAGRARRKRSKRRRRGAGCEAGQALPRPGDRAFAGWVRKSQQRPRLEAGVAVAQRLTEVVVSPHRLDAHPDLLSVTNGTLDLSSGKLLPHRRADLITCASPVAYDHTAESPVFLAFLDSIFQRDAELIAFVQRWCGYSLTGHTNEQAFAILHGSGANGKSTLLEVMRHLLGGASANTSADTLMVSRNGRGPDNDLARLRGARLVTASESGEARQLDEERVKRITGGDTVTARFLYREPFEFVPSFKLWLATNARPKITGTDIAIWRRVNLIPFNVTIPKEEQDKELGAKLRAESERDPPVGSRGRAGASSAWRAAPSRGGAGGDQRVSGGRGHAYPLL